MNIFEQQDNKKHLTMARRCFPPRKAPASPVGTKILAACIHQNTVKGFALCLEVPTSHSCQGENPSYACM